MNLPAWRSRGLYPGSAQAGGVGGASESSGGTAGRSAAGQAAAAHHPSGATHRTWRDLTIATAVSCSTTSTRRSWRWAPSGGAARNAAHHGPRLLRREPHRPAGERLHGAFPQLEVTLNLTNQLLDLVHEGYDLALRLGHLKDSTLVARKLAQRVPMSAPHRLTPLATACPTASPS